MKKLNGIELFCGSGKLSSSFNEKGHNFKTVDIRKRKGKCMPDLKADILKISSQSLNELINFQKLDILWVGLPCDIWSYASGGFHLNKNYQALTNKAVCHIKILEKCQALIKELNPTYWFIENPRGKLRNYPPFVEWLKNKQALTYQLTLSSYGFPTTKPTNIFSNCCTLFFKELDSFGRGAKCTQDFSNLTKCQRQSYPIEFCKEIVHLCENLYI